MAQDPLRAVGSVLGAGLPARGQHPGAAARPASAGRCAVLVVPAAAALRLRQVFLESTSPLPPWLGLRAPQRSTPTADDDDAPRSKAHTCVGEHARRPPLRHALVLLCGLAILAPWEAFGASLCCIGWWEPRQCTASFPVRPPLSMRSVPAAAADEGDDPETLRDIQMAQCATAMLVAPHTAVTVAHPPSPPNSSLVLTILPLLFPLLYPLISPSPFPRGSGEI